MPDFIVHARRLNGDAYPPFLVTAQDEVSVTKMVQRHWLTIDSVRDHVPRDGEATPVRMKCGPPTSDTSFEQDYHNRPADKPADGEAGRDAWTAFLIIRLVLRLLSF